MHGMVVILVAGQHVLGISRLIVAVYRQCYSLRASVIAVDLIMFIYTLLSFGLYFVIHFGSNFADRVKYKCFN